MTPEAAAAKKQRQAFEADEESEEAQAVVAAQHRELDARWRAAAAATGPRS